MMAGAVGGAFESGGLSLAVFGAGTDQAMTGLKEIVTGKHQKSMAHQVVENSFTAHGVPQVEAERRAAAAETLGLVLLGTAAAASEAGAGPSAMAEAGESGRLSTLPRTASVYHDNPALNIGPLGGGAASGESSVGSGQSVVMKDGAVFIRNESGATVYAETSNLGFDEFGKPLSPGVRNVEAQRALPGKLPGDHATHLLADRFGYEGGLHNLTPARGSEVNLSGLKRLENLWASLRADGHQVSASVHVVPSTNPLRGSRLVVEYSVDGGRSVVVPIDNPVPAGATSGPQSGPKTVH
jgi:hypothetical protein